MIPNIVVPMPMPIHGGGGGDGKAELAVLIAVFMIALFLNIVAWLRNGLKYKIWNPLIVVNDNEVQKHAQLLLVIIGAIFIIVFVTALIYYWL